MERGWSYSLQDKNVREGAEDHKLTISASTVRGLATGQMSAKTAQEIGKVVVTEAGTTGAEAGKEIGIEEEAIPPVIHVPVLATADATNAQRVESAIATTASDPDPLSPTLASHFSQIMFILIDQEAIARDMTVPERDHREEAEVAAGEADTPKVENDDVFHDD
jgi:hypothetical protein